MSTPQKRPSTRHYLLTTSDNRRYALVWQADVIGRAHARVDNLRVLGAPGFPAECIIAQPAVAPLRWLTGLTASL
jgi:hypothetical protein